MLDDTQESPAAPVHTPPPQYPIESVDNALRLLWLIAERSSVRMTEAARYLGVASSTAHRLLAMLEYRGLVAQNPVSRAYEPGPTLENVAFSTLRRMEVRERARPVLERLNIESGETVHLGQLEGTRVHFIDAVEGSQAVRVGSRLGRSLPAHCTSTGKSILALLTEPQFLDLFAEEQLEKNQPRSIGTRTQLWSALAETRKRGYASSREESEEGVASVAVALGLDVSPLMAVNISAPTTRMSIRTERELAKMLRAGVNEIRALVSRPPL
jgi:DNA-binding IclR family transcriptional regulator